MTQNLDFMQIEQSRILKPSEGYPKQLGILVSSLEYCRKKTMLNVHNLTIAQLDYRQDERANSIGLLLMHMAAVEVATQRMTFHNCGIRDVKVGLGRWEIPLTMGEVAWQKIQGHAVDYYFEQMAAVRAETLRQFQQVDDGWLWHEYTWKRGIITNNYWLWYHVFEDEMGHRGEINWLRSRIPPSLASSS